jgi:putative redox protein
MPHATIKWIQNQQFLGIDSSKHSIVLSTQDEPNGIGCKPSDMLLIALGSCTAVDIVEILAKKRTPLSDLRIEVTGEQDPEPPWTFRKIHLHFELHGSNLTPAGVEQAIRLSEEKYCAVAATIRGVAQITWDYVIENRT